MGNGVIENFNKTIKNFLKVAAERPKDWYRYLGPLMFAVRDTPQDSTGFTPFELLYGYRIRTPMTLLKKIWTGSELGRFRGQNSICRQPAWKNWRDLWVSKKWTVNQKYYNRRTRERKFHVGDSVLLLLFMHKLTLAWRGPYKFMGTVGEVDWNQCRQSENVSHQHAEAIFSSWKWAKGRSTQCR